MKKLLLTLLIPLISLAQNDCIYNEISITVEGTDSEIGWNIAQENGWAIVSGALNSVEEICIQDGCWTFNMYDSLGDGWVNTSYTISYTNTSNIISSGTLENGNYASTEIQIGESLPCFSPTQLCDSIAVSFIEFNENENHIVIDVSTQFSTQYWFGYAGFTLTNSQGEIIATENLQSAGNAYGIGSNMYETRFLEITDNFAYPFFGTINLINGLFAGSNPEHVCSWPLYDTEINENQAYQKSVTMDVLGKSVNNKGIRFIIFKDGSVEKKYLLK